MSIGLILALFMSLIVYLAAMDLLLPLVTFLLPLGIAVATYRLCFARKRHLAAEKRLHLEAQLIDRLSIKRNDLACQKRWLHQLEPEDTNRRTHLAAYKKLRREIRLLEGELVALRQDEST